MDNLNNMNNVERKLDDAKRKYLDAKQEIETLRLGIAKSLCPLKIGERIKIEKDGKEYEGIVEAIHYAVDNSEFLEPVVGAPVGWRVYGHRIKKTDGNLGKRSFDFSNFDAKYENNKWVVTTRNIFYLLDIEM